MNAILFNIHDIALVMTITIALLFSIMLLSSHKMNHTSAVLLAAFLVSHAFIALHELTFYGEEFRYTVLENFPNLVFIGSLAYCLDAALLYFYVRSSVDKDFKFQRKDLLHLGLFFIYLIYLVSNYYSLDLKDKIATIETWELYRSWHFTTVELTIKLARTFYVVFSFSLIAKYYGRHKDIRSDISDIDLNWLKLLLTGFMAIILTEAALSALKVFSKFYTVDISVLITIGVSTYYATFILVVSLLFYSVTKSPSIIPVSIEQTNEVSESGTEYKSAYTERIENYMRDKKPYLISEITLEALAKDLGVSIKDLSVTINRHFQMNFYEFINHYRINEAKSLLINCPEKSITDIFYEVGFNSKSVFNNYFKKEEGMTPSAYRKRNC